MASIKVVGQGFTTDIEPQGDETLTAALKRGQVNCFSDSGTPFTIQVNGTDTDGDTAAAEVPDGATVTVKPPKLGHGS